MSAQASEKSENVKRSLFNYIVSNYTETALQFQGSEVIDTTALSEWVWFGITGIVARIFMRDASKTEHADLATYLVTAEINVKPTTTITRPSAIADVVRNLLRRPAISVVDYAGAGSGEVGKLNGWGVMSEVELPIENDLRKYVITFQMRYLEKYAI